MTTQKPTAAALATVAGATAKTQATTANYTLNLTNASALGGSAQASGLFDFVNSQGTMNLSLGQNLGSEQVVFTPYNVYLLPASASSGPPWIQAAFDSADATPDFKQIIFQVECLDPGFILAEIRFGAVSVAPAGQNRFVVTVDLAKAAATVSGPASQAYLDGLKTEISSLPPGTKPQTVSIVVAVDKNGYLVSADTSPPGSELGDIHLGMSGFGTKVTIGLPAASQTRVISQGQSAEPTAEPPAG